MKPVSREALAGLLRHLAAEMGVEFVDGMEQGELSQDDFRFVVTRPGFTPDVAVLSGDLTNNPRATLAMAEFEIKKLRRGPRRDGGHVSGG